MLFNLLYLAQISLTPKLKTQPFDFRIYPAYVRGIFLDSYGNSLVRMLLHILEQAGELYRFGGLISTHETNWHLTIVDGAGRFHLNIH